MEQLEETMDYSLFDAEWYFDRFYVCNRSQESVLKDMQRLSLLVNKYNIGGKRLLDVGTGPSIYSVIAASRHVDEIYLSDYAPSNLCFLQQWLVGNKSTPVELLRGTLNEEKSELSPTERENQIRQKVKGILHIDVNKSSPLGEWKDVTEFDAIISSSCFECAVSTVEELERAFANVTTLLKVGGHFLVTIGIEAGNYQVRDYSFKAISISRSELETALTKAGLTIYDFSERLPSEHDLQIDEFSSFCYILAKKESQ